MRVRFWSSTEYSGFLEGLMRELAALRCDAGTRHEAGWDARQCFQISEASYRSAKSAPARLFLRFRQYVAYPVQLVVALLARRMKRFKGSKVGKVPEPSDLSTFKPSHSSDDVCVVSTNTFYAPLLATYLHPNVVHLVYDLFPEAMIHSGKWTEGTLKVRMVRWITKQTLKRAKTNVFLGERLKDYVESIHGPVENAAIIAVGADQALFGRSPKERLGKAETLKFGKLKPMTGEGQSAPKERLGRADGGPSEMAQQILKADEARQCLDGEPKVCPESAKGDDEARAARRWSARSAELAPQGRLRRVPLGLLKEQTSGCPLGERGTNDHHSAPTVLYCGNFGNMHDSATLFEYWRQLSRSDVLQPSSSGTDATMETTAEARRYDNPLQWLFHCSGPKRAELEAVLSEFPVALQQQIHLGGGLSQAAWVETMEAADVALVTMVPGSETVVMPSKTYSAMMAGQAILAIAPEDSDLVDLIKAADCGWFVEPGDVDGLAKVIDVIGADPEGLLEKRQNAYCYAHAHLGQDALAKDWARVVALSLCRDEDGS